ncbi:MAG: TrmH family RNA methyltransferase [Patiriisocius sp.]|jgi:TrmH family RNA methyltransferase
MISNNRIKYLKSLHLKKFRDKYGQFLVEGDKIVKEAIKIKSNVREVYALNSWMSDNPNLADQAIEVDEKELKKISQLSTHNTVIALMDIEDGANEFKLEKNKWYVALDKVQDPGNLGTIIRTLDWFGLDTLICSPETVETLNPKVIQSTMGSIFRVNVIKKDLNLTLDEAKGLSIPIYGAVLSGSNIYEHKPEKPGILIFGNESKGISPNVLECVSHEILIPGSGNAESLNVSVSAGIAIAWAIANT